MRICDFCGKNSAPMHYIDFKYIIDAGFPVNYSRDMCRKCLKQLEDISLPQAITTYLQDHGKI